MDGDRPVQLTPLASGSKKMASDARLYVSRPTNIPVRGMVSFQFEDIDEPLFFHFIGWKYSPSLSAESCRHDWQKEWSRSLYASEPRMNSIVTSSLWEILLPVLDDFSDACVEKVDVPRCRRPACRQESVGQLQLP